MRRWTLSPADGVPAPIAPYAHATSAAGVLCVTGQMPIDPVTGLVVGGGIAGQTGQVMRNLAAVLDRCGARLADVLHARAYLVDMEDFADFNAAYEPWFEGRLPARTCVAVSGLALGALVEVDLLVAAR
jgi:2-iminobutanoate/2-iminopropanoate deaminase